MATTCMAFSSMTASIFGQNLFFNASNFTPVRLWSKTFLVIIVAADDARMRSKV